MDNVASWSRTGAATAACSGRYQGVPLTERGAGTASGPDDARPHHDLPAADLRPLPTEDEVVEQVRITVVHEVAHHFGIDDHRLTELGWG